MKEDNLFLMHVLIKFIAYSALACLLFQVFVFGKAKIPMWFLILVAVILIPTITIGNYYLFLYTKRRKK